MIRLSSIVLFGSIIFNLHPAVAQNDSAVVDHKWCVGLFAGWNANVINSEGLFSPPMPNPGQNRYDGGSGSSLRAGVTCEKWLTSWNVRGNIEVTGNLYYENQIARFVLAAPPPGYDSGYDETLHATLGYVTFNVNVKQSFGREPSPNGFYLAFGSCIGLLASQRLSYIRYRYDQVVSNTEYQIPELNKFRFALNYELGYDLPVSSRYLVSMILNLQHSYTKISRQYDWSEQSASAALAVKAFVF